MCAPTKCSEVDFSELSSSFIQRVSPVKKSDWTDQGSPILHSWPSYIKKTLSTVRIIGVCITSFLTKKSYPKYDQNQFKSQIWDTNVHANKVWILASSLLIVEMISGFSSSNFQNYLDPPTRKVSWRSCESVVDSFYMTLQRKNYSRSDQKTLSSFIFPETLL